MSTCGEGERQESGTARDGRMGRVVKASAKSATARDGRSGRVMKASAKERHSQEPMGVCALSCQKLRLSPGVKRKS